jgi:hypothetical protein
LSIPLYIYRGEFVNTETTRPLNENIQKRFVIDIEDHDTLVDDGSEQILIDLELTGTPLVIKNVDNSEEPFTAVKPLEATIQCYTSSSVDLSTFAKGADDRFFVHIYESDGVTQVTHFKGILSTADLRQEFLPDPNILQLIATDGLGGLKDIALTDFDGLNPQYEHPIMSFITWALSKKGYDTDLYIVMNVRHEDATTLNADNTGEGHFYKDSWLDAKTWEDENTSMNCFDVLERIFKDGEKLFQHEGNMWILRIDEIEHGHNYTIFHFDAEGTFIDKSTVAYEDTIGVDLPAAWMDDNAEISLVRLFKQITETFRYEKWREVVCNIGFSRGTLADPAGVTVGEVVEGDAECIEYYSESLSGFFTDLDQPVVSGAEGVLRKVYDFGVEVESYLAGTAVTRRHYFKMTAFPVAAGDKLEMSVDTRTSVDTGITNLFPVHVLLIANNGDLYVWDYDEASDSNQWVAVAAASGWFLNNWSQDRSGDDTSEWRGIGATSHPVPAAGKVYIRLIVASAGIELRFQNLQVEILPLVNGSYRPYTGHEHTVAQDADTRNVRKEQVYINDGPSAAFKGVLLRRVNTGLVIYSGAVDFALTGFNVDGDQTVLFQPGMNIYIETVTAANDGFARIVAVIYNIIGDSTAVTLDRAMTVVSENATITTAAFEPANRYYAAHVFPDGPPDSTYVSTFGRIQAMAVWNQYNRVMSRIEGTVDGTLVMPSTLRKYLSGDAHPVASGRIFQLLHFDLDVHLCQWEAFIAEVSNENNPKQYEGYSFKYLTE